MVSSNFNTEDEILYVEVNGRVELQDMQNAIDAFANNNSLPRNLKILEDSQNAIVTFTENDIPAIVEKLKTSLGSFKSIKHAVVHADPINTALAFIVENEYNISNYQLKTFATIKSAKHWILK